MTYRIQTCLRQIEVWRRRYNQACYDLQLSCTHGRVVEFDYVQWAYSADRPLKVCLLCGFCEEGWSCGHQILKSAPEVVYSSREKLHIVKHGPVHSNRFFVRQGNCTDRKALYQRELYRAWIKKE